MKKLISTILATAMIMAMGVTAFADTNVETDNGTGDTKVKYSVSQGFTVTIPAEVTATEDGATSTIKVAAEPMIADGKEIQISLSVFDGLMTHESDTKTTLAYTISVGQNELELNEEIAAYTYSATEQTTELTYKVTGTPTLAGNYTDTVTFKIALGDKA